MQVVLVHWVFSAVTLELKLKSRLVAAHGFTAHRAGCAHPRSAPHAVRPSRRQPPAADRVSGFFAKDGFVRNCRGSQSHGHRSEPDATRPDARVRHWEPDGRRSSVPRIGRSRYRSASANGNPEPFPRVQEAPSCWKRRPTTTRRLRMKTVALLALTLVALIPLSGVANDALLKFEGGVGVHPVSNVAGTPNADGSFPNVTRNIVRGVTPAGQIWVITDLRPRSRWMEVSRSTDAACCWRAATRSGRTRTPASSPR